MKFLARLANIVPVDPDAHLLAAMKLGAWGLRQGRVLCIFPEGSRTYDGELIRADIPLVRYALSAAA